MASISLNNLCKCWKKPARNSHLSSSLQAACLQPTAADYHILIRDLFLEQFLSLRNLILK